MRGTAFSKELRRKATDAESKLWGRLRGRRLSDHKFRRQVPMGPYTADFLSFEGRLLIELDGNQHVLQVEYDSARDCWFQKEGFRVLRFSDRTVLTEMDRVLETKWIALHVGSEDTLTRRSAPPSPMEGEGRRRRGARCEKQPAVGAKTPLSPRGRGAGGEGAHEG